MAGAALPLKHVLKTHFYRVNLKVAKYTTTTMNCATALSRGGWGTPQKLETARATEMLCGEAFSLQKPLYKLQL
ncbi:MAG: hypothetical protein ACI9Y1_001673 [Lentisphaeria bacterium]|jgi:hypothetical protein